MREWGDTHGGGFAIRRGFGTLLILRLVERRRPPAHGCMSSNFRTSSRTATPKGQMAQRFKELAEERFPGRVRVEVYPSAQLMEDTESIEALAFGEIQMIATSLSVFDRLTQKFQLFDLPFLFPDLAAVERFQRARRGVSC